MVAKIKRDFRREYDTRRKLTEILFTRFLKYENSLPQSKTITTVTLKEKNDVRKFEKLLKLQNDWKLIKMHLYDDCIPYDH